MLAARSNFACPRYSINLPPNLEEERKLHSLSPGYHAVIDDAAKTNLARPVYEQHVREARYKK